MATTTITLNRGEQQTLTADASITVQTGSLYVASLSLSIDHASGSRDFSSGTVLEAQHDNTVFSVTDLASNGVSGQSADLTDLTQRVLNLETNEAAQNTAIAAETTAREAAIDGIDPLTSETTGQTLAQIQTILGNSNRLANNNVGLFALLNDILSRIETLENN